MTLHQLEAQKMARRIQSGELSAEAVLRSCLEKIEAREEVIGAWEHLDSRQALEQAQNLDRKTHRGLLHGVPVGAKDIFDTSDMSTEYGSAIYSGHRPVWDAASIAALRAAGAMILGKTVTTEFAIFHPGKTVNPKAPTHTPGGSSSGSAAAVADDMVPLALGTQTAGSIIRPASYCGVVGYKPTFGLIHRAGVKSISESLDTVGTLTRSVADAALLTTVLAGRPTSILSQPSPNHRASACVERHNGISPRRPPPRLSPRHPNSFGRQEQRSLIPPCRTPSTGLPRPKQRSWPTKPPEDWPSRGTRTGISLAKVSPRCWQKAQRSHRTDMTRL